MDKCDRCECQAEHMQDEEKLCNYHAIKAGWLVVERRGCLGCGRELEYEYDEYQAALTGNGLIDPGDLCSHCETVEDE